MPTTKTSRARACLRALLVLALILLSPFAAAGQPGESPAAPSAALTPPRLVPETAPTLPALPAGAASASVVLELTVGIDGSARDPVVLSSLGRELDEAALAAVPALRFEPARRDGEPVPARIPFHFTFHPAPPAVAAQARPPPVAPSAEPEAPGLTLEVQGEKPPRETTVHSIELDESQKLPGTGGDPLRAVEALPGIARPPGFQAQLVVRGSAPEDSAIFVDGIRIPLAYHFGGVSSVVPNDALSRLEFRPGNFGAEYGRAMGGVVELGLRAPRRDRIGGVVQLDAIDGRVMIEGPLGPRTRFLIGARRSWVDTWIRHVDEDIERAPVYYDAQAVLEHDFTRRTTARLFFLGADDRIKLLFDAPVDNDPAASGRLSIGTRFARVALGMTSRLTDDVSLRQTLSYGTDAFNLHEGREFQDIKAHTIDARLELRARFAGWITGTVGIDAQLSKYHVRLRVRPYPTTDEVEGPGFSRPTRAFDERVWLARPAAYALLELTPLPGVRIIPALRADYAHDTREVTLDPRVTMRGEVHPEFPRTTLKGGVGFYTQPPLGVESVEPFGTKGVESNRSLHASAGIEQELARGLELSLEGFYKQLSNLVVSEVAEDSEALGARFVNSGEGRAYGGEALLRYRHPRGRVFGWVAYTLSRSERRARSDQPYHPFEYDQTHILTALGNVELGRGFATGARFRYVTGSPYTPVVGGVLDLDAGAYAPVAGAPYGARLPAFHQLDLRVDKTWSFGTRKLVAYLELRNAYNRENAEEVSYRYDYAASKRVSGLPILPTIGLRGEL